MVKISIIGMGLIGASLGMALRSADERDAPLGKVSITGYDKNSRSTSEARGRLAIDREARTLDEAVRDAQIVIVAVPVQAVREVFTEIGPLLAPGAIVTDVSSTKAQVLAWAAELLPKTTDFVGGHPMAGKEQAGVRGADPDLFRNAIYCLTPATGTRQQAIDAIEALVHQIRAKIYYIDPFEHDGYMGGISHLPFLLSAALIETTSQSPAWQEMAPLAATGFRDISRLASGDAEMHRDICITNRTAMVRWIDDTVRFLMDVREQLEQERADQLLEMFKHARDVREAWLETRPNMRPGESDFENMSGMQVERPSLFGRFGRPKGRK